MTRAAAWPTLTAQSGISHYYEEIRRFPMLDRQEEEYMLAKRWRETVIATPRISSSPAICVSLRRSPRAIAATVCRSPT